MSLKIKINILDPNLFDLIDDGSTASTNPLIISKVATENISALRAVKADNPTDVSLANFNLTFEDSNVLGISLNAATIGNQVQVLTFGEISDNLFTGFNTNGCIFLGSSGIITQSRPSSGSAFFLTKLGKSLGSGGIFININPPIELV